MYINPERRHIIEELPLVDSKLEWKNEELGHKGKQEVVSTFEVTDKNFRSIAKIGFHYFLQHFDHYTGHEKEFDGIKNFILNGGDIEEWVTQYPNSFVEDFKGETIIAPDRIGHFFVAEDNGKYIFVKLVFFVGPKGFRNMHYEVRIGKAPGLIITKKNVAHQILYFKQKDDEGYIGEMKKMMNLSKEFLQKMWLPRKLL